MIKTFIITGCITTLFFGCVQKASNKTVVYILHVNDSGNINSVGIRGRDKPLNWQNDFEMKMDKSDSTFRTTVTYLTGYKFTEAKFTVNNEFEFKNEDNRKIVFSDKDTTVYTASFNERK